MSSYLSAIDYHLLAHNDSGVFTKKFYILFGEMLFLYVSICGELLCSRSML